MTNPSLTPEQEPQLSAEILAFQASALEVMDACELECPRLTFQAPEGLYDVEDLHSAIQKISEAAAEDPSILGLLRAVNEFKSTDQTDPTTRSPRWFSVTPEFGLLKLFTEAKVVPEQVPVPKPANDRSRKARRIGQQVLADGHVVNGLVGPGEREVRTNKGIVRTRGIPRRM